MATAIRGVLFDLDGTLIDSAPQLQIAVSRALMDLGYQGVKESMVRDWIGNGAQVLMQRALQEVKGLHDDAVLSDAMALFHSHYQHCSLDGLTLYDGVRETLFTLHSRDYPLGIVTNKPMRFIQPILEALGLEHLFACTLGGDSLATRKPDPAPLLEGARLLGVPVAETLMVGDSKNDVEAAQRAQMRVAALNYGYNYGEPIGLSQPDWVLQRFPELLSLLLD